MIIIESYSNVSVTYTADGTQTVFSFPFDYLRKAFVKVEVAGEAMVQGTDYLVSSKTVVFNTAPNSESTIRIFRETSTTPLVSWADASVLRAKDMTIQQIQVLHILEEYKGQYDEDLANMLVIAGVVTDSGELQHIVDQLNAIDENAEAAATSEANALSYKNTANTAANTATNAASSATTTAQALTNYLETKETLTAPAIDTSLSVSGAAADAKITGNEIKNIAQNGFYALFGFFSWEEGGINDSTGETETGTKARTTTYVSTSQVDLLTTTSGTYIYYYNLVNGEYQYSSGTWFNNQKEIDKTKGYFKVLTAASYSSGYYKSVNACKYTRAYKEELKSQGIYVSPMYVGSGGAVSWVQTNNNCSLTVAFENDLHIEGYPSTQLTIRGSDVLAAATSYGLTVSDNTISGINYAIVYNVESTTVRVVNSPTYKKNKDEIILFRSYYNSYVSGLLVDYEIRRRYQATLNRISTLEAAVDSGSMMPDYWLTYMQTKIADVQDKDITIGNHGDSFIFVTDIHYENNDKNSPPVVRYILERSSVDRVICGGDTISGSTVAKSNALTSLNSARNMFRSIGVNPLYLRGNHDNNTEIASPAPEKVISDSEVYGILFKPVENEITMGSELNFYFDNKKQKIRYICLDTGHPDTNVLSDAQITWMQNRITELESGWSALVLTHQYYSTPPTKDGNGTKILAGLNAIYDTANATIIGVICGHSHHDYIETTAKGFPVISTTCDIRGGEGGGLTRNRGTVTEQAFDVFHIDTENRMIYATRIGAGSDRSISY